jgi:c-di-GMP-binding flagellar brake protein YcgR
VEVGVAGGQAIAGVAVDVSRRGMQIACDRTSLLKICPRAHLTSPADGVWVRVKMRASEPPTSTSEVDARARVVCVRRLSQVDYRIGIEFSNLAADTERSLVRWIETLSAASQE